MVPRKGAEVAMITEQDIKDVLEVRAALEELAVNLACQKISDEDVEKLLKVKKEFTEAASKLDVEVVIQKDVEFHDVIYNSTKNEKLIQIINNLREQIYRFRVEYIRQMSDFTSLIKEHDEIVSSIVNKDSKLAKEIAAKHIENQEKAVIGSIK